MRVSYFILIFVLVLSCCATTKQKNTVITGGADVAMQIAINDFVKNCKLYKKDSVFHVSFEDSLYRKVLKRKDEKTLHWTNNQFYENVVTVNIFAHHICEKCEECTDKFFYTAETTVGSKGKLPSRYIEKDSKLFYWWDDNYPLTEEMLAILWKYNLLCDNTDGHLFHNYSTNDSQKGADYYFCKNNLAKFKRVITNIAIGWYDPPKLKCK
jgi:hypothetical protein